MRMQLSLLIGNSQFLALLGTLYKKIYKKKLMIVFTPNNGAMLSANKYQITLW